jgi:hypothetical protein
LASLLSPHALTQPYAQNRSLADILHSETKTPDPFFPWLKKLAD